MNGAGNELLAGPALARDEDRGVAGTGTLHECEHLAHGDHHTAVAAFSIVAWGAGLAGAWLFRVTDLMRKRAVHSLLQRDQGEKPLRPGFARAILRCHGALAWPSARLLALGYALAGSFEDAVSDWRAYYQNTAEHFFEVNNDILARAGCGAQGVSPAGEDLSADGVCELEADAARSAMGLVVRTLIVWVTFIALATLLGWTV